MTITSLVQDVNKTYKLNLTPTHQQEIVGKLRLMGSNDGTPANQIVDRVLEFAKSQKQGFKNYERLSARTKVTAATFEPSKKCPKCGCRMTIVGLLNDRKAYYCASERITLPMKVE
jgi:hypothetical protein